MSFGMMRHVHVPHPPKLSLPPDEPWKRARREFLDSLSTRAADTPSASAESGGAGAPAGLYLVCYDAGAGTCLICLEGEIIAEIAGERARDILDHVRTLTKSDRAVFVDGVLFALRAIEAGGAA